MTNKAPHETLSYIPFEGFYHSVWAYEIENAREYELNYYIEEYDLTEDQIEIISDGFFTKSITPLQWEICKAYTNHFIQWINKKIDFNLEGSFYALDSPKEYNFETDKICINIPNKKALNFIDYILKNHKKDLEDLIKERFTNRDGFISFYPNSLDKWPTDLEEWDHNHLGTCFELFEEEFKEEEFYRLQESISELIISEIGLTLSDEANQILDDALKEKERKEEIKRNQLELNLGVKQ